MTLKLLYIKVECGAKKKEKRDFKWSDCEKVFCKLNMKHNISKQESEWIRERRRSLMNNVYSGDVGYYCQGFSMQYYFQIILISLVLFEVLTSPQCSPLHALTAHCYIWHCTFLSNIILGVYVWIYNHVVSSVLLITVMCAHDNIWVCLFTLWG